MTSNRPSILPFDFFRAGPSNNVAFYTGLATAATLAIFLAYHFQFRNSRSNVIEALDKKSRAVPPEDGGKVVVSKILVHPIKSCRGTSVQSARYDSQGLENDRMWCVVDAAQNQILTAREVPKLVLITPRIEADDESPDGGQLVVSFPEDSGCETFTVPLKPSTKTLSTWTILPKVLMWATHPPMDGYICQSTSGAKDAPSTILSKYIGKPIHLLYKGPQPRYSEPTFEFPELKATAQYQDMYPLLVLSEENAKAVEEWIKPLVGTQGIEERWKDGKILVERFRPNIVLRGAGPFGEDKWEEISIGSKDAPKLTLVSKCTRCLLPNVDPLTGTRDAAVPYKVIMKHRKGIDPVEKMKPCVGCNAVPERSGVVRVGDVVYVKKKW